jgi:hypothetical protein
MHLNPASLSTVDWYADGGSVVTSFNDVAHLLGAAHPEDPAALATGR